MSGFAREQLRRTGGILLAGALLLFNPAIAQEDSQTAPRPLTTPDAHFAEAFDQTYFLDEWEADRADIHWTAPAEEAVFIAEFRIRFRDAADDGEWQEYTVSADSREFRLFELLPERAYTAQVKALAPAGQGRYTDSAWAEVTIPRAFAAPELRLVDIYTVSWQQAAGEPETRNYVVTYTGGATGHEDLPDEDISEIPQELRRNYPKHILGSATVDIEDIIFCDQQSDGECFIQWSFPFAVLSRIVKVVACEAEIVFGNWRFCQHRPTSWRASKLVRTFGTPPYQRYPLPAPQCPHHTQLFLFSRTLNLKYQFRPYHHEWICAEWRVNLCSAWPGEAGAALMDRYITLLEQNLRRNQKRQPELHSADLMRMTVHNTLNERPARQGDSQLLAKPDLGVVAQEISQPVYCETGTTRKPGS